MAIKSTFIANAALAALTLTGCLNREKNASPQTAAATQQPTGTVDGSYDPIITYKTYPKEISGTAFNLACIINLQIRHMNCDWVRAHGYGDRKTWAPAPDPRADYKSTETIIYPPEDGHTDGDLVCLRDLVHVPGTTDSMRIESCDYLAAAGFGDIGTDREQTTAEQGGQTEQLTDAAAVPYPEEMTGPGL